MHFIEKGPDVPERLLQAHEEGRVVFFCGAGISYPANLPGFGGLVTRVRDNLGITFSQPVAAAFKRGQYDSVLGLLEGEVVNGREVVRRQVATILTPNLALPDRKPKSTLTVSLLRWRSPRHAALVIRLDHQPTQPHPSEGGESDRTRRPRSRKTRARAACAEGPRA